LTGIVRDAVTRKVIGNAEVESIEGANVGRGMRTDPDGSYRLDGLVAGSMTIRASADGYAAQTASVLFNGPVFLNRTENFDLTSLQTRSYRFFGVVRDGLGNPVRGVSVLSATGVCQFLATTDQFGRYDGKSNCDEMVLRVLPPRGYEGVQDLFEPRTPAGERNYVTKRIVNVVLSAPSQISRTDGPFSNPVTVFVTFDDGTTRRLGSQDLLTLQSSNPGIVRPGGFNGSNLTIQGVTVGTATVTTTYWSVMPQPVSVTVF
jgi:hypothetical protein